MAERKVDLPPENSNVLVSAHTNDAGTEGNAEVVNPDTGVTTYVHFINPEKARELYGDVPEELR